MENANVGPASTVVVAAKPRIANTDAISLLSFIESSWKGCWEAWSTRRLGSERAIFRTDMKARAVPAIKLPMNQRVRQFDKVGTSTGVKVFDTRSGESAS